MAETKRNPADAPIPEHARQELAAAGLIGDGEHPTYMQAILAIYEKLTEVDKVVFYAYVKNAAGEAGLVMKAGAS